MTRSNSHHAPLAPDSSPTTIVRHENPFEALGQVLTELVGATREALATACGEAVPVLDDVPAPPADLLTVPEAAKLLRINVKTAYDLIGQRKIPATKVGNSVRVHREVLLEWLKTGGEAPSGKRGRR